MAGLHRSMWHVVLSSGDMNVSTSTTATGADTTLNDVLRTACGHQFPSHKLHTSVALKLTSGQALCQHSGCKKGWSSL